MSWTVSTASYDKGDIIQGQYGSTKWAAEEVTLYQTSGASSSAVTPAVSAGPLSSTCVAGISADVAWFTVSPSSFTFTSGTSVDTVIITATYNTKTSASGAGKYARGNIHIWTSANPPYPTSTRVAIPIKYRVLSNRFSTSTAALDSSYANPPLWGGSLFRRF